MGGEGGGSFTSGRHTAKLNATWHVSSSPLLNIVSGSYAWCQMQRKFCPFAGHSLPLTSQTPPPPALPNIPPPHPTDHAALQSCLASVFVSACPLNIVSSAFSLPCTCPKTTVLVSPAMLRSNRSLKQDAVMLPAYMDLSSLCLRATVQVDKWLPGGGEGGGGNAEA